MVRGEEGRRKVGRKPRIVGEDGEYVGVILWRVGLSAGVPNFDTGVPPWVLVYFGGAVDVGMWFWRELGCVRSEEEVDRVAWRAVSRLSRRVSERLACGVIRA